MALEEHGALETARVPPLATVLEGTPHGPTPYVYERLDAGEDFFTWHSPRADEIERNLRSCGAVLFRGFSLSDRSTFDRVLGTMCRHVIAGYGDLPPEEGTDRVYGSTPYRSDRTILFHNESSHMASWPTRQFFACVVASEEGGETPLADCRRIYQRMTPAVRDKFAAKGLLYVRHFIDGFDVSWRDFFKTSDKSQVEKIVAQRGGGLKWKANGTLMVTQPAQAVARNAVTGEASFFNQIMLHHSYFMPAEDREALSYVFAADEMPRSVTYGDQTPIEDGALREVKELYASEAVAFRWKAGDLLMVDNMSVAHARRPFKGARKIIVGMGDPIEMFGKGS
jgi:alpha-ketoglutarate-dependent taurine dioxygenase